MHQGWQWVIKGREGGGGILAFFRNDPLWILSNPFALETTKILATNRAAVRTGVIFSIFQAIEGGPLPEKRQKNK